MNRYERYGRTGRIRKTRSTGGRVWAPLVEGKHDFTQRYPNPTWAEIKPGLPIDGKFPLTPLKPSWMTPWKTQPFGNIGKPKKPLTDIQRNKEAILPKPPIRKTKEFTKLKGALRNEGWWNAFEYERRNAYKLADKLRDPTKEELEDLQRYADLHSSNTQYWNAGERYPLPVETAAKQFAAAEKQRLEKLAKEHGEL